MRRGYKRRVGVIREDVIREQEMRLYEREEKRL